MELSFKSISHFFILLKKGLEKTHSITTKNKILFPFEVQLFLICTVLLTTKKLLKYI